MTLTLTLPTGERVYTGRQVTFQAPCASEGLTGLIIEGVTYALVDSEGNTLVANSFAAEAMVSVIFNVEKLRAYVQNANTNAYLEGKFNSHNQAASTITAGTFAGQVVANSSGQTPGTSLLRNSKLVSAETDPTVNGEINWTYE